MYPLKTKYDEAESFEMFCKVQWFEGTMARKNGTNHDSRSFPQSMKKFLLAELPT